MRYPLHAACAGLLALGLSAEAKASPMTLVAAAKSSASASFDVVLPLRDKAGLETLVAQQHDPSSSSFHQWLTPQQVHDRFGPDAATLAKAVAALTATGMSVSTTDRLLHVTGTTAQVNAMLRTTLAIGRSASGHEHLFAMSTPSLPSTVSALGGVVIGLGRDAHEARPQLRKVAKVSPSVLADPKNRTSATGGYWYDDLKQAYQYPSYQTMITKNGKQVRLDGTGATVGILMSSDIYDSDIAAVFDHENFKKNSGASSDPALYKRVLIDGGADTSTDALDEASLDTQEALTGAPGSHVILYEIPSLSDNEILNAYFRIVTDNQSDVVSSSFGGCELLYTAAYNSGTDYTSELAVEHEIFLQGNAQGISFLASSGDEAGLECPSANYVVNKTAGVYRASVSVPAADPNVTAVGGTNVVTNAATGSLDSTYAGENAYGDPLLPVDPYSLGATVSGGYWGAGGGLSTIYAKPSYQTSLGANTGSTSYRALPDIGMQVGGCPSSEAQTPCNGGDSPLDGNGNTARSYVIISVDGSFGGVIGTSVSSPELAGAVALLVEQYGRMGNLNPYIYSLGAAQSASGSNASTKSTTVFHRAIPGYNGVVTNNQPVNTGNKYFNYTVGNGTPVVYRFVGASTATPAGTPQSASNP